MALVGCNQAFPPLTKYNAPFKQISDVPFGCLWAGALRKPRPSEEGGCRILEIH